MLSRQARSGFAAHRISIARLNSHHPNCHALRLKRPSLGRYYAVSEPHRPQWRRAHETQTAQVSHERTMATAVQDVKFDSFSLDPLAGPTMRQFQGTRLYDIRAFDPASPLTVPQLDGPRAMTKTNRLGVPGDVEDMLPIFEACLRVGKLDRAAMVLKRLATSGNISLEEQAVLNNQYLRASVEQLRSNPDKKSIDQVHRWFERDIHRQGTPRTAETIACMLKLSLLFEKGDKLDRLIRHYMWMAPGEGGKRVLGMTDILSDSDIQAVTEVCPEYSYLTKFDDTDPSFMPENQPEVPPVDPTKNVETTAPAPAPLESGITATKQKGVNLSLLKKDLGVLSAVQHIDVSTLPLEQQEAIQLELERGTLDSAIERWRDSIKRLREQCATRVRGDEKPESLSSYIAHWLPAMEERIREELRLVDIAETKATKSEQDLARCIIGPFLKQSDPARLAALTILSVLNLGALSGVTKGIIVTKLITGISRLVQEDIDSRYQEAERKDRQRRARERTIEFNKQTLDSNQEITDAAVPVPLIEPSEAEASLETATRKPWSMSIKAHISSILIKALVETAKIKVTIRKRQSGELVSQNQPAFTHLHQLRRGKKTGVLLLNKSLTDRLQREPLGDYLAKHLPMLVPPKPWTDFSEGGFLAIKSNLVRIKPGGIEQRLYTEAAIKAGDMDQVLKGLDVLGQTAWRINTNVLDVMKEAWNDGEAIANLPAAHFDPALPPEPEVSSDPLARRAWVQQVKAIENKKSSLHSQRCFMNLQLEIADAFRNQTIYFPHNVDYRGRAYPVPAYLNHMGADHTRAMLRFAKGKELGVRGLRWLKIHLANVYGMDKSSFDEREAFAEENMDNIIDSATHPLKGSRWWLQGEDPWQCLAVCYELKAAMELPDPTKYVSSLPVHQDGTCNGLQHYAALGGDSWGARQVNLEPGERPADVYSAVADLVKKSIDKDAEAGEALAKVLQGKITRKVVKQTVMTNVYGVTFSGAKLQVLKQLDALYPNLGKSIGTTNITLSVYVAKLTFDALATMFRGAHDIQYWLGNIGGRATRSMTAHELEQFAASHEKEKSTKTSGPLSLSFKAAAAECRSTIIWTTPLRMPVVQPYRKGSKREVRTCLQAVVYHMDDMSDPVNRRKQLQAFPPNFIHSLDASHMMLSALQCNEKGLEFAAVHDSFWTHAGDVDTMNQVLRDTFIRIHEEDAISRLAAEFQARHKGSLYLANINASSPAAKKIKQWRKESKLPYEEELLLEYKRQKLLNSDKADDVKAGKELVTPASLYEDMAAAEEDVSIKEDTEGIGIGEISASEADLLQNLNKASVEGDAEANSEVDMEETDVEVEGDAEGLLGLDSTETARQLLTKVPENTFTTLMTKAETKSLQSQTPRVPFWMPLIVPPIPKKGDFDVKRLRGSTYFFS